jgi:processive 1,2-diacylglycerol beta-glucosyltransferase
MPLDLHVLYEYGSDYRPHSSSVLRLVRPLTHPAAGAPAVTFDSDLPDRRPDAVLVDRLWRPDITLPHAERLLERVRARGARFLYAIDDNLLDLRRERGDWPTPEHEAVVALWLRAADGVVVTTRALAERFRTFNPNIVVVPNALDERLLVTRVPPGPETPFGERPVVIGYMGTPTHGADLALILPALREVCLRHRGRVVLEMIGVADDALLGRALDGLPARCPRPKGPEREYGLFLLWLLCTARWDIAVSPLAPTLFNRGKSDVKFLDYAALAAAPVVSRHPAYEESVRHGETGLLVDDDPQAWNSALAALIEDAEGRREIARRAAAYLHRDRTLASRGPDLPAALARLLEPAAAPDTPELRRPPGRP